MSGNKDRPRLVALFTDFGGHGLYTGQMEAALYSAGVSQPIVNLMSSAPCFNPWASSYLLAALCDVMPDPTLFLAIVDPGVGGERLPLLLKAGRHWFVGPDNGLLSQVIGQSQETQLQVIDWQGRQPSASFHGRDLFAPVAAVVARGGPVSGKMLRPSDVVGADWPEDIPEVIYVDDFGSAITGLRATRYPQNMALSVPGVSLLPAARTFSEVPVGRPFWYANSLGLIEIAVNQGRADHLLGLKIGDPVQLGAAT